MIPFKLISGAGVAILLTACSAASNERAPSSETNENNGGPSETNAARTTATATAAAPAAPAATAPVAPSPQSAQPSEVQAPLTPKEREQIVQVPEDVLRQPAERMALMQQVRAQIVYKTKKIPEAEYEQLVRPSLVSQLRASGFAQNDVDQILSDVDYSRRIQGIR